MPLANWLRKDVGDRIEPLPTGRAVAKGILNGPTLQRMIDEHMSGKRDYARCLWAVLMFESFLDQFDIR